MRRLVCGAYPLSVFRGNKERLLIGCGDEGERKTYLPDVHGLAHI